VTLCRSTNLGGIDMASPENSISVYGDKEEISDEKYELKGQKGQDNDDDVLKEDTPATLKVCHSFVITSLLRL
jgi:hypothetical protein